MKKQIFTSTDSSGEKDYSELRSVFTKFGTGLRRGFKKSQRLASAMLIGSVLIASSGVFAQAPTISYPVNAQDINRGYGQSLLTVKVVFNGSCSGATSVKVSLPPSVTYVSGSVVKTGGTAGIGITEGSISNLSNPEFNITGTIATGNEITFTVARRANCGMLATAKDSVFVNTSGGCSNASELLGTVNTYNLLSPALSFIPAPAVNNAVIGTTATRTTTITNGGNGASDTVRFYIVYPGGAVVNATGTNTITANTVSFTPWQTNGDTLFYKIYGATIFGGNNLLTSGETITINEPIRVAMCGTPANATVYNASWGAPGCQSVSGSSAVTMAVGVANLAISTTDPVPMLACTPGTTNVTYANTGSGGNAGAIYNITSRLGFSFRSVGTLPGINAGNTLANFRIGSTVLTVATAGTTTAPFIINLNQLSTDPDGAGVGLDDLDGDGQYDDLAPGKSFVIAMDRIALFSTACPRPTFDGYVESIGQYTTMCGTAVTTPISPDGGQRFVFAPTTKTLAPVEIVPNQQFTFNVSQTNNPYRPAFSSVDSLELLVTLPAGFSYVPGTATLNGSTAMIDYAVVTGNVLEIRRKAGVGSASTLGNLIFDFDLTYDATVCVSGTHTLTGTMQYVMDRSCGAIDKMSCFTTDIRVKCPVPCPSGLANYKPVVQRQTLGWTDNTMTTKVSAASLSAQSLHTLVTGDSVLISSGAKQIGSFANFYYSIQFDKTSASADLFNFGNGVLRFKAAGSSTIVSTPVASPVTTGSTTALTKWDWNFTSVLGTGGFPSTLNTGDSVWLDLYASVLNPNNGTLLGGGIIPVPNAKEYFYNLDGSAAQTYCESWWPELYLAGFAVNGAGGNTGSSKTLIGCSPVSIEPGYFSGIGVPYDVFKGEFRPTNYIDSVVITLPVGITWNGGDITHTYHEWSAGGLSSNLLSESLGAIATVNGQNVTIKNPGTWSLSDLPQSAASYYSNRFFVPLVADCRYTGATGAVTVTQTFYGTNYYYNPAFGATQPIAAASTITNTSYLAVDATKRPATTVQNNTGIVQGVKSQHSWDVQVNSTGTATAPNVWIALEKGSGSGGVIVDSVKLLPSLTTVPVASVYNGTDKWYQLSAAGINSGANQQARVFFHFTSCNKDSIQLKSGWNCAGYPSTDPSAYTCTASSTYLVVDPMPSQVQLSVARQPGGATGTVSLCNSDSTILIVNSAQAANLANPYVTFYPPAGVTPSATIQVEYPLGSGNYQPAAVTSLTGGGYKIDLTAHTNIGNSGILGTASSNPSFSPLGGDRQAKINLTFNTGCSYSSGSSFVFNAYGNQPCGIPAIGNGSSATTASLKINGVVVTGGAGVIMSFGAATSASCGTVIPVSLTTTPTSVGTSAGDTMIYTLPVGLAYAGGLTAGFTADTSGTGGATIIKIAMPVPVAAGTPINYGFNVVPKGQGCGSVNIAGVYKRSIAPLMCGTTACSGSSVIIASATSPNITLNKPSLNITGMSTGTTGWQIGTSQTIHLTYSNTGTQAYVANIDTVEFFCGSSIVPFAKRALTKSVAVGGNDFDDYTILVPTGVCASGDLITAKIQTTTAAGTSQCLCAPSTFVMSGVPLPVTFNDNNVRVENCAVSINWTYGVTNGQLKHFMIERSTDGRNFVTVATVSKEASSYVDVTPGSGSWFYRIKAVDVNTEVAYSTTMEAKTTKCNGVSLNVYPNPASNKVQVVLQGMSTNNSYTLSDATGRTVLSGKLQSNSNNAIDVSQMATGMYLLKVVSDETIQTTKLQISK